MSNQALHSYLTHSSRLHANRPVIIEPGYGEINYKELEHLSNRIRDRLIAFGVKPGQRVGLLLHKSIDAVACIFGILKSGAAYVPVDVNGPLSRAAYIFADCSVTTIFMETEQTKNFLSEFNKLTGQSSQLNIIEIETPIMGASITSYLDRLDKIKEAKPTQSYCNKKNDLAYILYTSGSTGTPKGVPLSHLNATAFVNWCSNFLKPNMNDRFSAHAPFHFDLSILDIYTSIKHGAALVLLSESNAKDPKIISRIIEQENISIWYSTPSVLIMLLNFGNFSECKYQHLRKILFAGEVFPVKYLRELMLAQPKVEYYNLYGPTETNVCTFQPIPPKFPSMELDNIPIGSVCHHLTARVVNSEGITVEPGQTGELIISGDNVMEGYWNLPNILAGTFFELSEQKFYRTGDLVVADSNGVYTYIGRKDRMVKKRGYRIELGEIETKLRLHQDYYEIAVLALARDDGIIIHAHLASINAKKISTIKLKKYCSEHLPVYMIPDNFHLHSALPKTSTDKIDYQALLHMHDANKDASCLN